MIETFSVGRLRLKPERVSGISKELHKGFPMVIHIEKLRGDPRRSAKRIAAAISALEGKIQGQVPIVLFAAGMIR